MTYAPAHSCRSCGSADLRPVLDLGTQPLANAYPLLDDLSVERRFPLAVVRCGTCVLVQLAGQVDPREMFDDYLYFSSFSTTMLASVAALARRLTRDQRLGPDDLVVEVASNDGYLLKAYIDQDVRVLGVEPAANIAAVAEQTGVPTVVEYFGRAVAERLVAEGQSASILHANNVLAHVPDINDFVAGIAVIMRSAGIAVIETPWLVELVRGCEFDTIYHEHVFYYSLTALRELFDRHGLQIIDVEHLTLHGGSLRLTVAGDGRAANPAVAETLEREHQAGVATDAYYADFADRVERIRTRTVELLRAHRAAGGRVAAYGAAAKGTVLLNHFGIDASLVDFVVDRNPHKQGRRMPGVSIPVVAPEALVERQPGLVLLLAWNFEHEILDQQARYRAAGGRFLVPVPEPRIV